MTDATSLLFDLKILLAQLRESQQEMNILSQTPVTAENRDDMVERLSRSRLDLVSGCHFIVSRIPLRIEPKCQIGNGFQEGPYHPLQIDS